LENDVRNAAESILQILDKQSGADGEKMFNSKAPQTLGPVPDGCRFFLCGHTHKAGIHPVGEKSYYINTGCWRPIAAPFRRSQFRITQPLNVIEIARRKSGNVTPKHIVFDKFL
jgi:hypothetical protein